MNSVKKISTLALSLLLTFALSAQDKSTRPSPPDQVSSTINGTKVTIDYSQPSKKGRTIFGDLVAYGKVWRTGANESSWIEVSNDVKIEGKTLPAGKYGLFSIPGEDEWTIIFNSKWDGWGGYQYKEDNDVLRVKVRASSTDNVTEKFTIMIEDSGNVVMAWDQTKVSFGIQ